jgi:hypothetical protein
MPKVMYFILKELAFLRTELYAGFSDLLGHFLQAEQVLLERETIHDHVM